ncbi:stealth conserved region 3 domain-containing protein [Nocardioides houyundeii]|uniref:stealth conserved region 3 domain-containing protein n=1 Tax=Nocardioides houyundeii TaxID=2045452 RepID=UPI000DF335A6|nr:stealth conserved region 3 domain-containing protein [Nocardioides houyundeii]
MALGGRLRTAAAALRSRDGGRLRIGFVLYNADGMGGTARSAITQANALAALPAGHQVSLISVTRSGEHPHYRLHDDVGVEYLVDVRDPNAPRAVQPGVVTPEVAEELARRESVLVPRRWDASFSALTDAALRAHLPGLELDVVVTTTPELLAVVSQLAPADVALVHQEHRASSRRVNDLEALLSFAPRADVVASLTGSMNDWLAAELRGAAPEMVVMPNPLPTTTQPRSPLDAPVIVSAGRLVPEKQFEHVIDAFAQVSDQLPGWTLRIWGDGPRRAALQGLVRKRGLEGRVELPGATEEMAAEWARSSVVVLASRSEGFPLVVQEAMSAGVPVVSYDCPSGPREIITHDRDGLLVPPGSKAGLAAAMLRLASDAGLRARLGAAALESSTAYEAEALAARWVEIYHRAVARRRDPVAPRRVLHGRRPGPVGTPPEGAPAAGVVPAAARSAALRTAVDAARAAGDGWFVIPAHALDPGPVLVVPMARRTAFLEALAAEPGPDYLSLRDPAERGWPERRGTAPAMAEALLRTRGARIHLEPWPGRGGHHGLLAEGAGVTVEFWDAQPSGDLVAPDPTRYGDRLPAGAALTVAEVEGVEVATLPEMLLPTTDECRFDIDVVYTWVDGDDPDWNEQRIRRQEQVTGVAATREASGDARYRSRDELRYSMRSVHLFAPWVRRIHLVTAGQVPDWLDTSDPRISVVDHRDVFPTDALPTFSSHAIETRLHHVPGLAERFVYLNDDVFLGRPRRPEHFFSPAGAFAAFVAERPVGLPGSADRPYLAAAENNRAVLREAFGVYLTHTMVHSPHPQVRSVLSEIEQRFPAEVERTTRAPFRSATDISLLSSFAQHYGLLTGKAYPGQAHHAYVDLGHQQLEKQLTGLLRRDRDFFCVADHHDSALGEEQVQALLTGVLEQYFPVAAPWEK